GYIDPAQVDDLLKLKPAVVSVMWVNNEIGVVQPVREFAERGAAAGGAFHTDAVQALGKVPVDLSEVPAALAAFSAHKIGGPKGVGGFFVRRGTDLAPLIRGGVHERGFRAGTEDVAGAVGMAVTAGLAV